MAASILSRMCRYATTGEWTRTLVDNNGISYKVTTMSYKRYKNLYIENFNRETAAIEARLEEANRSLNTLNERNNPLKDRTLEAKPENSNIPRPESSSWSPF